MTVRTLMIAGALIFFGLLATAFGTTVVLLGDDSGGARTVGLTNRQGMLSQKVAKEALAYARAPTQDVLTQLRNTMHVFSVTQRALRYGGSAPLDLDGQRFEQVVGATDPELQRMLQKASSQWDTIVDAIEQLIVAAQRRTEALNQVELKNPRLMRKMDEVTSLLSGRRRVGALQLAGQQGIAAERAVKEALMFDIAPDPARRDQLLASIGTFELGHSDLRNGRARGSRGPKLRRPGADLAEKLDEANWLWIDQAEALTQLANEEAGYHRAVRSITQTNPELLETLSAAAVRADLVVARNVRRLEGIQLAVLAMGVLIALAAIVVSVRLGASLRRLRDVADAISRGDVDSPVGVQGIGEIRDLSRSFERMRLSLQKAMELIERSGAHTRQEGTARSTIDLP